MSETRKIEFTEEPFCRIGRVDYYPGDMKTLPKEMADLCIERGWAKCAETGEQGERKPGSHKLEINNATQQAG